MSSFYDDASLVVIPSGYKTSKVYAEKPTDGSGDLAFTRTGDTASRVNSAGLIEMVRTNLALYSEQFDNAYWVKYSSTITANTSETTDPLGGNAADIFVSANTTAGCGMESNAIPYTSGVEYTVSVYCKYKNTSFFQLLAPGSVTFDYVTFNIQTGTIVGGSYSRTPTITSVGNGWYRCSFTFVSGYTGTTAIGVAQLVDSASSTRGQAFTGDGVKAVYIFGAQVETGVATAYIPTLTAAVSTGPTANVPRLDYLGSTCGKLLLEGQRTNLALYSEQFTNAVWAGGGATGVANQAVSPDGYTNADLIYPTVSGNFVGKYQNIAASTTGVVSCYVKQAGKRFAQLGTDNNATYTCAFDLQLGTVVRTATNYTATITSVGNGWYRITAAYASSAAASYPFVGVSDNAAGGVTDDGTNGLYVYGFQYELSASYATSYIPTLAASATRGEDFYAKAGFGNTSTAGTLYYEFQNHQSPASASGYYMVCLFAGSTVTSTDFSPAESISIINNGLSVEGRNDGYATTLFSITPAINATVKVALRYDGTNVVAFVNGVKGTVFSDTAVGAKNAIRVNNGQNATHATKQLLYFPSALTDAQLIELTTL